MKTINILFPDEFDDEQFANLVNAVEHLTALSPYYAEIEFTATDDSITDQELTDRLNQNNLQRASEVWTVDEDVDPETATAVASG